MHFFLDLNFLQGIYYIYISLHQLSCPVVPWKQCEATVSLVQKSVESIILYMMNKGIIQISRAQNFTENYFSLLPKIPRKSSFVNIRHLQIITIIDQECIESFSKSLLMFWIPSEHTYPLWMYSSLFHCQKPLKTVTASEMKCFLWDSHYYESNKDLTIIFPGTSQMLSE